MSGRVLMVLVLALATSTAVPVSAATLVASSVAPAPPRSSRVPVAVAPDVPVRAVAYRPPVPERLQVLRIFVAPATEYGPGHRGVDLRAGSGVLAAGDGVVRFAGQVAGRGVVVVAHPDGIRTEYEPVRPSVRAGQGVRAGQVIGMVAGRHPGCPGVCLHWGARRGADYLDPLGLLRPLGPVRLLPWGRAAP